MPIANLRVPIAALPSSAGSQSWIGQLGNALGGVIDQAGQDKSYNALADQLGGAPAPQPGFLSRLFGGQQAAAPAPQASGVAPATIAPAQGSVTPGKPNDIYNRFIGTVQANGVTNPNALAAIAATGRAESSYDPSKVNAAWPDPSQSGQAGTAGGIMSWRNERLAALRNYATAQGEDPSNISPETQAKFFLQEDPSLVQKLNSAKSPQEAASLMANAWKFQGYDQQGGEAARRQALAQNYYATQFANQQPTQVASAAPSTSAPQAATAVPAGNPGFNSDRFASGPVAQGNAGLATAMSAMGDTTGQPSSAAPYVDPQVTIAAQGQFGGQVAQSAALAPQQVAQAAPAQQSGPQTLAAGVTPVVKGTVSIPLIQSMLRDPNLRQAGMQLWQQNATGKTSDGWDFVKLDDGTLARANKQTGQVETLGNFQSSKKELLSNGKGAFYDSNSGQWITPPPGAAGDGKEFFGTTVPYYDAQGQLHYRQLAKDGNAKDLDFGPGATAAPPTRTIDTGTELVTVGPGGQEISRVPKQNMQENRDKALGTEIGKQSGDAVSTLPQVEGAANQMLASIDSLANDPYLPNMLGKKSYLPNFSSESQRVQSKMDQIGGQSFLQAYNSLRGGGSITEVEGAKATAAMGRLNTAQNETDYREALQELRDIVSKGVERARQKAAGAGAVAPVGAQTKSGVSWKVEE